tara:strand:- start:135 stop:428 length:294 start_codon:yes stop_codon:yes gene_type:complete
MSLVFTPKIPKNLIPVKTPDKAKGRRWPELKRNLWSQTDTNVLIGLRAVGVSYKDCAKILKRSHATCVGVIANGDLYAMINAKRKLLIDEVLATQRI